MSMLRSETIANSTNHPPGNLIKQEVLGPHRGLVLESTSPGEY